MRLGFWTCLSLVLMMSASQLFAGAFNQGPYEVSMKSLKKGEAGITKPPLVIVQDMDDTEAPVIYFNHGFQLSNKYYEEISAHISSYGYVVVAPQNYSPGGLPFGKPTKVKEAEDALDILQWIHDDLEKLVGMDIAQEKLGLLGHSRGGAVVYKLASDSVLPGALATIDPVDGTIDGSPRIITGPFPFTIPSFVVGTGLGGMVKGMGGACAPERDNHEQFYENSPSPSYHMLVSDYGHMDMLDKGTSCGFVCNSCVKASSKYPTELLRQQIAGSLVKFFDASLKGSSKSYGEVLKAHGGMNIKVDSK